MRTPPARAPEAPEYLGPYRVLGVLGRGGMGIVYRGEHVDTGEAAAVKTVRATSRAMLATIRREIHALSRVRHPGIIRVVAQGVADGLPWYAMPLLPGPTLRDSVSPQWFEPTAGVGLGPLERTETMPALAPPGPARSRGPSPLPPGTAASSGSALLLLRRLCAPLAFLHGCGLVHRDLKPENVVIHEDGRPILVDLGIAALSGGAEGREELSAEGGVMGTVAYMAPEQIRGELVDARADLYALGCILYEAVTGRPPFTGDQARSVLHQHLHDAPVAPSRRAGGVPEALDTLILRLLEKRPQDRLGYAEDVAAVLGTLELPDAREDGPAPRPYLYRPVFSGREEALEVLARSVERVRAGQWGGLVLIRGESGVGKTRLALEVTRLAAQRGLLVLTGQCVGLGVGEAAEPGPSTAPLHPLRPLLLAVADLARAGGEAETQRLLGARAAVLAAYEPALGGLAGPGEPPALPELPPDAARARVIDSVRQTLFALAASTPLVLLLDDLQWMDELSLSVLETLAEEPLARPPVLVVGTYRSEETPPVLETLARAPGVTVIPLGRLDGDSVGSMVSGMLALRAPPVGVLDVLVRQSDGNPFFVAEYLRAAISEGMLTRDPRGRWHFDERGTAPDSLAALPLPRTLAELIDRRLSRLDGTGHALVAWGSVLGREFDAELLLADTGHSEGALLGAMEALRVRNILEEAGAGRLRFGHDKLRETAYERIPVARRRALHQRAGELLEARHGEAADLLPVLAHHFARGEVHDKASHYFVQAARRARAAYANGEAIAFYGSALTEGQALLASGDDPGRHDALGALQEELGDVLALAGRQADARAAYQQALMRASGASLGRARLLRKEGKTRETHHQHDEALASYAAAERALEASQEGRAEGWWHEWLQLQVDRVSVHYFAARQEEMEELVRRVQPVVEQRGAPVQRASFFQALVQKNLRAERYRTSSETVEHARASLRAREEVGEPGAIASARFALGAVLLWHDAFGEALDVLTEALRAAERRGDLPIQARCLTYLAMLHRRRRMLEPTRQWSNQGLEVATSARMADYAGAAQANLAWVALRRGDLGDAERQGLAALDAWKPLPLVYPFQWTALLPLACIEQRRGRHAEAVARLHAALDPKQQRLPDALGACFARCVETLEHGPTAHLGDLLQRALTEAEREGFL